VVVWRVHYDEINRRELAGPCKEIVAIEIVYFCAEINDITTHCYLLPKRGQKIAGTHGRIKDGFYGWICGHDDIMQPFTYHRWREYYVVFLVVKIAVS
jgi:hypothetical protein